MENKGADNFRYPGRTVQNINASDDIDSRFFTRTSNYSESNKNIGTGYINYKKIVVPKIAKRHRREFTFKVICCSAALSVFIIMVAFFPSVLGAAHNEFKFMQYDRLIWPVVMQDPDFFSEDNPPSNELLLDASVWKAASEKSEDSCSYDNKGRVILSTEEIETACKTLFGDERNISPENIKNKFYEYNPEQNLFYVDAVSHEQCFMPNTVGVTQHKDLIILKVDYVNMDENSNLNYRSAKCYKPKKHMEYLLRKNAGNGYFYISGVRETTHDHWATCD